jgi:hypothetical protein
MIEVFGQGKKVAEYIDKTAFVGAGKAETQGNMREVDQIERNVPQDFTMALLH